MTAQEFTDNWIKENGLPIHTSTRLLEKTIAKIVESYHQKQVESVDVVCSFPSKDDAVNVGFAKATNAEYNHRSSCKELDSDTYYMAWMDCYYWMIGDSI